MFRFSEDKSSPEQKIINYFKSHTDTVANIFKTNENFKNIFQKEFQSALEKDPEYKKLNDTYKNDLNEREKNKIEYTKLVEARKIAPLQLNSEKLLERINNSIELSLKEVSHSPLKRLKQNYDDALKMLQKNYNDDIAIQKFISTRDALYHKLDKKYTQKITEIENKILHSWGLREQFEKMLALCEKDEKQYMKYQNSLNKIGVTLTSQMFVNPKIAGIKSIEAEATILVYQDLLKNNLIKNRFEDGTPYRLVQDIFDTFFEKIKNSNNLEKNIEELTKELTGVVMELPEFQRIQEILQAKEYGSVDAKEKIKWLQAGYYQLFLNQEPMRYLKLLNQIAIIENPVLVQLLQNKITDYYYDPLKNPFPEINELAKNPDNIDLLNQKLKLLQIVLNDKELLLIKKQATYRAMLPKIILDNLPKDQIILGEQSKILATRATKSKITDLNNFIKKCNFKKDNELNDKEQLIGFLGKISIVLDKNILDFIYESLRANYHSSNVKTPRASSDFFASPKTPLFSELPSKDTKEDFNLEKKEKTKRPGPSSNDD